MAWRFKASKYKNAAPIVPKFEQHIRDLSIGCYRSHGNFVAASAAFMAFNWDINGSNLAVLPLDAKGRQNKANVPLIYAHSDMVTDFMFSPFDDGLLATGSQDSFIKLWRIPKSGIEGSGLSTPELTLPEQPRRVETITFHPTADCILASSSFNSVTTWDISTAKDIYNFNDHGDEVQSVSWQQSGQLLATQSKDRMLRILDPRQNNVVASIDSHQGIKDSRVIWVGGEHRLLTTGFSGDRLREINIWDMKNLDQPQKNLTLDMSSGLLLPLFDPDTNMCFLCGKGDRNIQFIEITNSDPYIVEGLKYSGDQTKGACLVPKRAMNVMQGEVNRVLQMCDSSIVPITWQVPRKSYRDYHADIYPETFGVEPGMGPENWLNGENNNPDKINLDPKKRPQKNLVVFRPKIIERPRLIETNNQNQNQKNGEEKQIESSNDLISREEENDESSKHVFVKPNPKPRAVVSNGNCPEKKLEKILQNNTQDGPKPKPRNTQNEASGSSTREEPERGEDGLDLLRRQPSIKDRKRLLMAKMKKPEEATAKKAPVARLASDEENKENKVKVLPKNEAGDKIVELRSKNIFLISDKKSNNESGDEKKPKRPVSKVFGRISKFKHLKGDVMLKGKFDNLKNLSKTCPAECNFVHGNETRVAVPLTGPGGKIAVLETRKPGRIPDGVMPVLINGTSVMDFCFDPFDKSRLVCGCDDGHIRVWKIPETGLVQQVNKPQKVFPAHSDKIQIVNFNPLASDVMLTAAFDRTVKIWNLADAELGPKLELEGHGDQLYSARFSQCGRFLATVCRDGKIRIFDPRKSSDPIVEGGDIVPKKGARVLWALNGEFLIVSSFTRQSERQVSLWRTADLKMMNSVALDVSPAILIPHYDEDSNTLFLTGKGESTVTTFEVSSEAPHFFPLTPYKPSGLHQGFAFLPKNVCDVKAVEFARAFRLTNKTIEPISFTVPRVKTNFFQDDLFPPTRVLWSPAMTGEEWFAGSERSAELLDLRPDDMSNVTGNKKTTHNRPSSTLGVSCSQKVTSSSSHNVVVQNSESNVSNASNTLSREETKKRESDLEASVSEMVGEVSNDLEQDKMEGVEEEEWEEEEEEEEGEEKES